MSEPATQRNVNLPIGGILVFKEPVIVSTVLGSCVSVCLMDEEKGVAGINHYMLPKPPDGKEVDRAGRFGNLSIPELIKSMIQKGACPSRMTAKIFGGAQMLSQFTNFSSISQNNIEIAKSLMRDYGIKVIASDVGGTRGRKILFHTDTGRVFVRQVGTRDAL